MSAARKLRRRNQALKPVPYGQDPDDAPVGSLQWLGIMAGASLELDAEAISKAWDCIRATATPETIHGRDEVADMLEVRLIDVLGFLGQVTPEVVQSTHGEVEARRGAGFAARVAAIGEPAAAVAERLRTSHKIQFGQLPKFGPDYATAYHAGGVCFSTSSGTSETSRLASRGDLASDNGLELEPASSPRRAKYLRSASAGAAGSSSPRGCHGPNLSFAFVDATAPSSARPGRPEAR